ncbi:MAG TPA: hypothetical protein VGJ74_09875 [Burkholderiales bacterium]
MREFIKAFDRHPNGSWTCIAPATFNAPSGRIQVAPGLIVMPGQIFMGIDLASWLERYYQGQISRR